jgi:hypothetical protein
MQKALSLPLIAPLPPNCIAQPLQKLHVKITRNILSGWHELVVRQTVDVKKFQ